MAEPGPADLTAAPLDEPTLARLFDDLAAHAEVLEVVAKAAAGAHADAAALSLEEGRRLMLARAARGVQIQYRWDGALWRDTILCAPGGWRIVRMRVDAPPPA